MRRTLSDRAPVGVLIPDLCSGDLGRDRGNGRIRGAFPGCGGLDFPYTHPGGRCRRRCTVRGECITGAMCFCALPAVRLAGSSVGWPWRGWPRAHRPLLGLRDCRIRFRAWPDGRSARVPSTVPSADPPQPSPGLGVCHRWHARGGGGGGQVAAGVVTRPVVDTAGADLDGIREAVDGCLSRFLDRKACPAAADRLPPEIVETLRDFLSVGKRIRPVLCVMGWRATGGRGPSPAAVVQVAAALEMFHAFALIHDAAPRGRRPTKPSRERSLSSVLLPAGCTGSRGSHAELQRLGRRVNRNRARLPPINLRSCVWGGR